jgi:hypothetical protein
MESLDHGEDWFVVGKNSGHARFFFAEQMGYDEIEDEITALEVCEVAGFPAIEEAFFADDDIIKHCGGELKLYDNADLLSEIDEGIIQAIDGDSRIVKLDNRIFVEGSVARTALYYLKNK